MPNERKYPAAEDGRLDSDSSPFAVMPNCWVNLENMRSATTDAGVTETMESIGSTVLISQPVPSVTYITIGSEADTIVNRVLKFNYNTNSIQHKIIAIYPDGTEYNVLLSSQVTGGLNWNKDYPIHSIRIVNGIVYFTDDLNDQRRVNIDAGIKLNNPLFVTDTAPYTLPISPEVITVLRPPPAYPLSASKVTQSSPVLVNNFIEDNAFQFSYRYYYRDGELSKPAVYSLLAPYNSKTDTFNRIDILVPAGEFIEQDVQRVDILVKYGNTNTFYSVKSWDKSITTENQEIINHNNGTQLLSYAFYNDTVGEAQDEAYSLTPFDSVPILSKTLEVFGNRLGFGNNLEGYNTPTAPTSLNATIQTQSEGSGFIPAQWVYMVVNDGGTPTTLYFVYILSENKYYDTTPASSPPFTYPVLFSSMVYLATGLSNLNLYLQGLYGTVYSGGLYGNTAVDGGTPSLVGIRAFKSGAPYKLSVVFYDFGDRKCGITGSANISGVALAQVSYQMPDRSYSTATFATALNWSLSNVNAENEIPEWATHYSVCITRCLLTRFFLQARSKNSLHSMTYVNRTTDNEYTFATSAYTPLLTGVGVDITNLQNFGMGYVFAEGDIVNIYLSTDLVTVYRLKVLDQSGRWLVCELQDLGTLNDTTDALFQIYTPYIQSINEPYYEVAQTYAINNPGTDAREFSTLSGAIRGDITILDRSVSPDNYITENMSPNDKYYLNWYTDRGRPNFLDRIGQQRKETNISYSNVLIPGTRTNGLSSFDALDEKNLPQECGAIQRLVLTSKVQNELGVVMLAVCYDETASIYIGEVQLYGSDAPSTLAQAPNVIGTINILKGSRGTRNPEAVVEYRGLVFFPDANNGKWVQYSLNGLDDISDYKMTRFWNLWFKQYVTMLELNKFLVSNLTWTFTNPGYTFFWSFIDDAAEIHILYRLVNIWIDVPVGTGVTSGSIFPFGPGSTFEVYFQTYIDGELVATTQTITVTIGVSNAIPVFVQVTIESLGGRPFIFTAVDPNHMELLISIPKLSNTPPKGYLPDYPNTIYPFDILDFQGKVIVYKLGMAARLPHFQGAMTFYAENFCTIQNKLYSFKGGLTYLHNSTASSNIFYGVQYTSKIMFVSNIAPTMPKVYDNISFEANRSPIFVYLYNDFPYMQSSDLTDYDFRDLEGVYYATIKRNKLATGVVSYGLLTGEKMRSTAMLIMAEFSTASGFLELMFVQIGVNLSKGQLNQIQK